jgi:hypothetical protein
VCCGAGKQTVIFGTLKNKKGRNHFSLFYYNLNPTISFLLPVSLLPVSLLPVLLLLSLLPVSLLPVLLLLFLLLVSLLPLNFLLNYFFFAAGFFAAGFAAGFFAAGFFAAGFFAAILITSLVFYTTKTIWYLIQLYIIKKICQAKILYLLIIITRYMIVIINIDSNYYYDSYNYIE